MLGTATSGQAARGLAEGAGIAESRTLASLTWRLEHARLTLTDRHVLVLDEAGMTSDTDLGRVLAAAQRAGAKVIVAGDDRQLGAVGPGGRSPRSSSDILSGSCGWRFSRGCGVGLTKPVGIVRAHIVSPAALRGTGLLDRGPFLVRSPR